MDTIYEWRHWRDEMGQPWYGLLPINESNNYALTRIASVYRRGDGIYVAAYCYPHSTGNAQSGWRNAKNVPIAKRYVEKNLSKFWEVPEVRKAQ